MKKNLIKLTLFLITILCAYRAIHAYNLQKEKVAQIVGARIAHRERLNDLSFGNELIKTKNYKK